MTTKKTVRKPALPKTPPVPQPTPTDPPAAAEDNFVTPGSPEPADEMAEVVGEAGGAAEPKGPIKTLAQLKQAYPALYAQLRAEIRAELKPTPGPETHAQLKKEIEILIKKHPLYGQFTAARNYLEQNRADLALVAMKNGRLALEEAQKAAAGKK